MVCYCNSLFSKLLLHFGNDFMGCEIVCDYMASHCEQHYTIVPLTTHVVFRHMAQHIYNHKLSNQNYLVNYGKVVHSLS